MQSESSQSSKSSAVKEFRLSSSVRSVVEELSRYKEVTASQIVTRLLRLHENYAKGRGESIRLSTDSSIIHRRPATEWIENVGALYKQLPTKRDGTYLNGRLVILGLSILDWDVAKELSKDFLESLSDEVKDEDRVKGGFISLLTPNAKESWDLMLDHLNHRQKVDSVPNYLDRPTKTDELSRKAFAQIMARRIRIMHDEQIKANDNGVEANDKDSSIQGGRDRGPEVKKPEGAFTVLIHGPWGSGKSSLLNFLSDELKREEGAYQWVVVNFNAWQYQRLGRPWWWLMNAVFQQGAEQLSHIDLWRSRVFRFKEYWWRSIRAAWSPYLLSLFAVAVIFWLINFFGLLDIGLGHTVTGSSKNQLQAVSDAAKSVSTILAAITAVWGLIFGLSRTFLQGSAQAATNFIESTRDPMGDITKHFNDLVTSMNQPVAIFIDDVDRCQDSYVVELLEGIQTLFSEAPVTYVIAADQRWISASYEKAYGTFTSTVEEPGRPLRYLFLEKVFHLSTAVPAMSPTTQDAYWQRLIRIDQTQSQRAQRTDWAEVEQAVQKLDHEKDMLEYARGFSKDADPLKEQYVRELVARRLADPKVATRTEHALRKFAPLLEPNPRAMKRLVNAYGVQRAIAMLVGENIVMEQLAQWTIMVLRWPILAEYLAEHPEMAEHIGTPLQDKVPERLRELFQDEEVRNVIEGKVIGMQLDEKAIRSCAYLRTSVQPTPAVAS
jgi:Cdc6-like AAA superfamily ATPase